MKTFLKRGAFTVIPTALSLWIIYSLIINLDNLGNYLINMAGYEEPVRGTGFVMVILLLMISGAILSFKASQWIYRLFESLLLRFPVLNTVYGAIKDVANLIDNENQEKHRCVLVKQGNDSYMLGFVTSEHLPAPLSQALPGNEKWYTVLYPISYQVAGVTNLVKEKDLIFVDWGFEQAMRFMLTAGVSPGVSEKKS